MIYCETFVEVCLFKENFTCPHLTKAQYSNVKALDLYLCSFLLIFEMMKEK